MIGKPIGVMRPNAVRASSSGPRSLIAFWIWEIALAPARLVLCIFCAFRWKFIGAGLQYLVFHTNDGLARKCERPLLSQFYLVLHWYGVRGLLRLRLLHQVNRDRSYVGALLETIERRKASALFGHPRASFLGYSQNIAVVFGAKFPTCKSSERIRLLNLAIELSDTLLHMGLFDKTMNPHMNFGIDGNGRVICIDIGELLFDDLELSSIFARQLWRRKAFWRLLEPHEETSFEEGVTSVIGRHIA